MEGSGIELTSIFFTFTLLMLLLSAGVVVFVVAYQRRVMRQRLQMQDDRERYQQELLETSYNSQEKERERIAKDLHDEVGAMLSAVKMNLHLVERKMKKQGGMEEGLGESRAMVDEVIGAVREISHDLMPPSLQKLGLAAALREFFEKMGRVSGVEMEFQLGNGVPRLEARVELGLYRIAQEVVNNALKHAEAKVIRGRLQLVGTGLELWISDNGRGFDYEQSMERGGLGLKSLASRAESIGGNLQFNTAPGKGTEITIKLRNTKQST